MKQHSSPASNRGPFSTEGLGDKPLSDQQRARLEKSDGQKKDPAVPAKQQHAKGSILMEGERILQDGILSRDATYRIIVSSRIGARDIERLIAKLELDKEILVEVDEPTTCPPLRSCLLSNLGAPLW